MRGKFRRSPECFLRRRWLRCGERAKILIAFNAFVKLAQKVAAVSRVIFPGVLAIEKDAHRQWVRTLQVIAQMTQAAVQIGSRGARVHAAIDKTNQVGKLVIAEQSGDSIAADLYTPRFVQAIRIRGDAIRVAEETHVEGAAEHSFVRAEPLETLFHCDGERLIGNGSFGRPKPGGFEAKTRS